jgi:hypothetical protein
MTTAEVKRSRYGSIDYGSQKQVLKDAQKHGRHVERSLHVDMRRSEVINRIRLRKLNILKMREEWYSERERANRGKYYTLEAFVVAWKREGFTEKENLDVIFYRSHAWLLPRECGYGD